MNKKKIFLASSAELKEDREAFEIFIGRKNKDWIAKDVFLELIIWEDFLDAMSKTRLQDEYNRAIHECDLFVMLFSTKVGRHTKEEFETAFGQFKVTNKPFVFTYFKDADISVASANKKDLMSLWAFKKKLGALGHFYTLYKNIDELKLKFNQQLDKLAADGFIELDLLAKDYGSAAARVREIAEQPPVSLAPSFTDAKALYRYALRLLDENKLIHQRFGPDSSASRRDPFGEGAVIWRARKTSIVIPNNRMIIDAFRSNQTLTSEGVWQAFIEFQEHAETFERSSSDRLAGKLAPRFPAGFEKALREETNQ